MGWLYRKDVDEVFEIEKMIFENPWDISKLITYACKTRYVGSVSKHKEKVIGFMFHEIQKNKLDIIRFAVHPDFRHMGIGTQIVKYLVKLSKNKRQITIKVPEKNLGAQLFFKKQGFRAIKVLHNFYKDSNEDAFLMVY